MKAVTSAPEKVALSLSSWSSNTGKHE